MNTNYDVRHYHPPNGVGYGRPQVNWPVLDELSGRMAGQMMLGGLGDGCGELRGLRQPGIPRLLCGLLRPQAITAGIFRRCWCNAENLSESVGISARAMQRFLTEARWSDETVIGRLQEYLAPRLRHPEAVWVFDGSDFSAGVARQLRQAGQANCQGGMFLAYVSPLGRATSCMPKSSPTRTTGGTTGSWPWRCWSGSWSWAGPSRTIVGVFSKLDRSGISGVRPPPQTQAAAWEREG